jgi:hypothetical protein
MAARRIKRQAKINLADQPEQTPPELKKNKIVAVEVANRCYVLTHPSKVEKVKESFKYLTDFKE